MGVIAEDSKCIFCDRVSKIVAIEENRYTGLKCPSCNLIYVSPRPTRSWILDRYAQDKSCIPAGSMILDDIAKRLHAKHNLAIIGRHIESGSILELGAGAGYFLSEARGKGFNVYGIEINKLQADFIIDVLGIPCESAPLNAYSFGRKKFDIIYHCNVLSHLHDPIAEFRKIYDKMESDGLLIFETGNLGDVQDMYYKLFPMFDEGVPFLVEN